MSHFGAKAESKSSLDLEPIAKVTEGQNHLSQTAPIKMGHLCPRQVIYATLHSTKQKKSEQWK